LAPSWFLQPWTPISHDVLWLNPVYCLSIQELLAIRAMVFPNQYKAERDRLTALFCDKHVIRGNRISGTRWANGCSLTSTPRKDPALY
jgi:hypothetical protein